MKNLRVIDRDERDVVYTNIREIINKENSTLVSVTPSNETQPPAPAITSKNEKPIPEFLQKFYTIDDDVQSAAEKPCELQRYLDVVVAKPSGNFNMDEWWYENRKEYPDLFKIFLKRDFSTAGMIVNDRRSVILPTNVENIIIARNRFCK